MRQAAGTYDDFTAEVTQYGRWIEYSDYEHWELSNKMQPSERIQKITRLRIKTMRRRRRALNPQLDKQPDWEPPEILGAFQTTEVFGERT